MHIIPERRSTRTKTPPIWMKNFVTTTNSSTPHGLTSYIDYTHLFSNNQAFLAASSTEVEPFTYTQAIKDPRWVEAMKAEITALEDNHTWSMVPLPKGKRSIGCKWVYRIMYKASGEIERFKASTHLS